MTTLSRARLVALPSLLLLASSVLAATPAGAGPGPGDNSGGNGGGNGKG